MGREKGEGGEEGRDLGRGSTGEEEGRGRGVDDREAERVEWRGRGL
jgi:hypothetical protein